MMCRALGVNRTSFHDWERRAPSERALRDAWLIEKIKQIHADSDGTYGARRIHAELRLEHGIRVGRKRVERLMKAAGISGLLPRKRRRTTVRLPGVRVAADLVERDFRPDGPNQTWSADITYISTWEGFLYLAHVQDLFSRLIVGWSMADHLRAELVVDALEMALYRRRPDPGLIHHSDQGCQYTAVLFGKRCAKAGIEVSMGSVGDCYDNAVCETFHATIKKEKIYRQSWPTRAQARSGSSPTSRAGTTRAAATRRSPISPQPSSNDTTPNSPTGHSRRQFPATDRSRTPRREPQIALQRIAPPRSASISLPTTRSPPKEPSRFQPGSAQAARNTVKGRTATPGLSDP
jgi:putative transposase